MQHRSVDLLEKEPEEFNTQAVLAMCRVTVRGISGSEILQVLSVL
jgi:hypothetical protein